MATPRKGKAKVKVTSTGKKTSKSNKMPIRGQRAIKNKAKKKQFLTFSLNCAIMYYSIL